MSLLLLCLFICLVEVFRSTREFFTHLRTSTLPVKGYKFDLSSTLMTIRQWGCFNVPHLLWHGSFLYYGHFRGPVALTPVAFGRGAVTSCFNHLVCPDRGSNLDLPPCGANALTLSHRGGVVVVVVLQSISKAQRYQAVIVWLLNFGSITYKQLT